MAKLYSRRRFVPLTREQADKARRVELGCIGAFYGALFIALGFLDPSHRTLWAGCSLVPLFIGLGKLTGPFIQKEQ